MSLISIRAGGLDDPRVVALLHHHITTAAAQTEAGSAHALDVGGLSAPGVDFWTAWDGDELLGTGALKQLTHTHGEVKSMHTAQAARGQGVGDALLSQIIATARAKGMTRLSLETGSWNYFLPAHGLYRKHGFEACGPFEGYVEDRNSLFFTRAV
jgi:putative acetyltransferase